jgi:chaperone required for assembly of F1-ATPase
MRDILFEAHFPSEPDPVKRAQIAMARQPLPKRFYSQVDVVEEGGRFALKLDGRGAKTPARNSLALTTKAAAEIVAAEWAAQVDVVNPDTMPATRIVNSALDGVAIRMDDVKAEILGFAGSDLVCYRADAPEGLVVEQSNHWDPVLAWVDQKISAPFVTAKGIIHATQPESSLKNVSKHINEIVDPTGLATFHVMTTIGGSCLIALMLCQGALSLDRAWEAATVDERWNIGLWGTDEEATVRLTRRQKEFSVAHALWVSLN